METYSWKPYISSNIFAQYKKKTNVPAVLGICASVV